MEVGAWLRGLGLGQYEAVFHDHRIDEQVLPHLTAEDLRRWEWRPSGTGANCSLRLPH